MTLLDSTISIPPHRRNRERLPTVPRYSAIEGRAGLTERPQKAGCRSCPSHGHAVYSHDVDVNRTTAAVQQYLDALNNLRGDDAAEPVIRALLSRAVDRLHMLCGHLLHTRYPRLTRGPMNLRSEEMLSAVVERLLKAMRVVRPQSVRQFFALVNQHMRWELNDLARRLDEQSRDAELRESKVQARPRPPINPEPSANLTRILDAIEALPDEEREVFNLVRVQGMTHSEAADVVGVAVKTIQRRLNRGVMLLADRLRDMVPTGAPPPPPFDMA